MAFYTWYCRDAHPMGYAKYAMAALSWKHAVDVARPEGITKALDVDMATPSSSSQRSEGEEEQNGRPVLPIEAAYVWSLRCNPWARKCIVVSVAVY